MRAQLVRRVRLAGTGPALVLRVEWAVMTTRTSGDTPLQPRQAKHVSRDSATPRVALLDPRADARVSGGSRQLPAGCPSGGPAGLSAALGRVNRLGGGRAILAVMVVGEQLEELADGVVTFGGVA